MFQVAKYGRADKDHYSADADSDVNADNAADHDHNFSYGDYDDYQVSAAGWSGGRTCDK